MTRQSKTAPWVLAAAVLAATAGFAVSQEQPAESGKALLIEGSTTVGPIADAFAEAFEAMGHKVQVKKTGSGDGAAALIDGRCEVATMSRFMKPGEFKKAVDKGIMPVAHVVAMDGVCVIVHPSNPIGALSRDQVKQIYEGKTTNWKQLGGPDQPVVAISRDTSSGTYECFHEIVMRKAGMGERVEYVNSNPAAHDRVAATRGGIAYVGLAFVDRKVKALKIDGITPSKKTIASGTYPVARPLFLFTAGYPKLGSLIYQFVTFHLSEKGHEIIDAKKFVPLTDY